MLGSECPFVDGKPSGALSRLWTRRAPGQNVVWIASTTMAARVASRRNVTRPIVVVLPFYLFDGLPGAKRPASPAFSSPQLKLQPACRRTCARRPRLVLLRARLATP